MNIEARVGVAVDGAQSALNSASAVRSSVLDSGTLSLSQKQPLIQPQPHFGTAENLLAGGVAGAFSKTCTAPLARLTILFQLQGMQSEAALLSRPSLLREASRIINEEGFRAFWKSESVQHGTLRNIQTHIQVTRYQRAVQRIIA